MLGCVSVLLWSNWIKDLTRCSSQPQVIRRNSTLQGWRAGIKSLWSMQRRWCPGLQQTGRKILPKQDFICLRSLSKVSAKGKAKRDAYLRVPKIILVLQGARSGLHTDTLLCGGISLALMWWGRDFSTSSQTPLCAWIMHDLTATFLPG